VLPVRAGRKLVLPLGLHLRYNRKSMKPITVKPKRRGRPPKGGREPHIGLRLSADKIEAIDAWAAKNAVTSRSAAIRDLIDWGLVASVPKPAGKR
jgi:hypothetical protein